MQKAGATDRPDLWRDHGSAANGGAFGGECGSGFPPGGSGDRCTVGDAAGIVFDPGGLADGKSGVWGWDRSGGAGICQYLFDRIRNIVCGMSFDEYLLYFGLAHRADPQGEPVAFPAISDGGICGRLAMDHRRRIGEQADRGIEV